MPLAMKLLRVGATVVTFFSSNPDLAPNRRALGHLACRHRVNRRSVRRDGGLPSALVSYSLTCNARRGSEVDPSIDEIQAKGAAIPATDRGPRAPLHREHKKRVLKK